ncbi:hypothetical protein BV921_09190 [Pectobacterium odoriferum]|uniref:Secreted protein n=1 Tax=Pectobacterium odoriferum TaxID=78398 RepID=A0ABD6VRR4_9GAMM|nr:hypothetical protein BV925_08535 [Pectobacterium odoriferum]POD97604.1 hypothetical protein BVY06_03925 [Pectobacterium odoriferum]POE03173.1 hypothetical protein BVY05_04685 [Pectobacterium odoriferum]POE06584.1 hypothetical protein BV916_01525 [Pectobacterium odoriferum]POE10608.1 hypothetical protein BV921_09190 [Pectobacterium odoriferum]
MRAKALLPRLTLLQMLIVPCCVRFYIYSSYFKLHVRWLHSLTRITYLSKLIGIPSLAAFLQLELFRV